MGANTEDSGSVVEADPSRTFSLLARLWWDDIVSSVRIEKHAMAVSPFRTGIRARHLRGPTALVTAFLLLGCSGPGDGTADATADRSTDRGTRQAGSSVAPNPDDTRAAGAPASENPDTASPSDRTIGGDGSPIDLSSLTEDDFETAELAGELGCTFTRPETSPILIAMGVVASQQSSQGIVKVGDYVERISAPGGFDSMTDGVTFSGAGKTVRIDVTGPPVGGGESPPRPAVLVYDRADGARLTVAGRWICGP